MHHHNITSRVRDIRAHKSLSSLQSLRRRRQYIGIRRPHTTSQKQKKDYNNIDTDTDMNNYIERRNDLIFPPSAIYAFEDNAEARAELGLDHPLMKSVSLNAYITASTQLKSDYLINSILKSVEERAIDDNATAKINEELRKLAGSSRSSRSRNHLKIKSSRTIRNNFRKISNRPSMSTLKMKIANRKYSSSRGDADAVYMAPFIAPDAHTTTELSNQIKVAPAAPAAGGAGAAGAGAAGAAGAGAAGAGASADVQLKYLLTYDKYRSFCQLSSEATNDNWKHIVESCFKFMFCNQHYMVGLFLILTMTSGLAAIGLAAIKPIAFKLAYSYHLSHPSKEGIGITELTKAPSWLIKRSGLYDKLPTWIPFIHTDKPLFAHSGHSKLHTTAIEITTTQLTDKYKYISDIDKRHSFYSMLLFIVINMSDYEITELYSKMYPYPMIDDEDEDFNMLVMKELLLANSELRREFENILPHCLFINTYTTSIMDRSETILKISTTLNLLEHDIFLRRILEKGSDPKTYRSISLKDAYKSMVDHLYYSLGEKVKLQGFDFVINSSGHNFRNFRSKFSTQWNTTDVETIDLPIQDNDYLTWTYYTNTVPIRFIPNNGVVGGAKTGNGVIVNSNNLAIFYNGVGINNVDTLQYKNPVRRDEAEVDEVETFPISAGRIISKTIEEATIRTSVLYNEKSRIKQPRDRLMGHLAALVYYPNDIIANVSAIMTSANPHFIYIGSFDDDPCYPMAANDGNPATYSRIHAWMIMKKGFDQDIVAADSGKIYYELYVVNRGSKTGYDWNAADADIVNGYLTSDRSLNCAHVLKKIIDRIDTTHIIPIELRRRGIVKMQIFSVGHSLGGYLSLALSHASVSRNIVAGISHTNITGGTTNDKHKVQINPYIIPIVFDPFITSNVIVNSFSFLPYARIHTVVAPASVSLLDRIRFTDPASDRFVSNLKSRRHNGVFDIFEYVNVLASDAGYRHRSWMFHNDIRFAHQLEHMNGLTLSYLADHLDTHFYINVSIPGGVRQQNLKAAHYSFTLPGDIETFNPSSGLYYPERFNDLCKTHLEAEIREFRPF